MTQAQQILEYLEAGNTITPIEALTMFGCLRLGARVWDLREKGYDIRANIKQVGQHKHVAEYSLTSNPISVE